MTRRVPDARTLAVWLRQAEWLIADAAHRLPTGAYTIEEQEALADALDQLANTIRLYGTVPTEGESPADIPTGR